MYKQTLALRYLVILVITPITFFLFSCVDLIKKSVKCLPPPSEIADSFSKPTENLITDIYFDSTLSMQGFVQTHSFSYYQQTIPLLERPIINLGGQANFYKFGTIVREEKLPERSYRDADKPSFYTDQDLVSKTEIQKVIDKANNNHLTVIITDLFQEESDIEILSSKIKDKFINNNLAIGILAVKSQYKGVIYDVGRRKESFPYEQEDVANLRPFYLLALGKHSDIARYFDGLLQTEMSTFPVTKSLIISSQLTENFTPFSTVETSDIKGLNEVTGVLVDGANQGSNFKEFTVKNLPSHYFETEIPFKSLPNIMAYSQIKSVINPCLCQINQGSPNIANNINNNSPIVSSTTISALEINANFNDEAKSESTTKEENANQESSTEPVKPQSKNRDKINVKIKVFPEKLEPQSTNCFRLSLYASKNSLPDWVADWNMSVQQIEEWKKKGTPFDGSKTYNLSPFLQTILNTTKPKVADFYLFVK